MADRKMINVDKVYIEGLRRAYDKAVAEKLAEFKFRDDDYVTTYAKYFLEHYEPQFGITTKK